MAEDDFYVAGLAPLAMFAAEYPMKGSLFGRKQAELTALSRRQGSALIGLSPDAEHTAQAESQETGTLHDNNFHGDPSFPKAGAAGGLCPTQEGDPQGHHDDGGEKQHQL